MSKNIIMQQKTASGYEELYPKADGDSSVIINNTTNQFLGGGSTVGDALEYLSKFGMYWWKEVFLEKTYGIKINDTYFSDIWEIKITNTDTYYFYSSNEIYGDEKGTHLRNPTTHTVRCTFLYGQLNSVYVDGVNVGTYVENLNIGHTYYAKNLTVSTPIKRGYVYITNRNNEQLLVRCNGYTTSSYITSQNTSDRYMFSPLNNAYPTLRQSDASGGKYWQLLSLYENFAKVGKIEFGSYIGTGSGDPTITFKGYPVFALIYQYDNAGQVYTTSGQAMLFYCENAQSLGRWTSYSQKFTLSGNSLTFTQGNGHSYNEIYNKSGQLYQYFALIQ